MFANDPFDKEDAEYMAAAHRQDFINQYQDEQRQAMLINPFAPITDSARLRGDHTPEENLWSRIAAYVSSHDQHEITLSWVLRYLIKYQDELLNERPMLGDGGQLLSRLFDMVTELEADQRYPDELERLQEQLDELQELNRELRHD